MLRRWPHLRGGWTNFYHQRDPLGYSLQPTQPGVTSEVECRVRYKAGADGASVQSVYFNDLVDCVPRLAQSISWVWQDTNRANQGDKPALDRSPSSRGRPSPSIERTPSSWRSAD